MPQIRISERGHRLLRRLAAETGESSEQILDCALDLLERERLLDAINAGYAALREGPAAWAEEVAERIAWEATLVDGDPE